MTVQLLVDGAVVAFYFIAITSIGLYLGRRENTLSDFALGGRSLPWWAVMASVIAAETSAATFLGAPGEGYKARSIAYAQLLIGLIIGRIFVGFVFIKQYYRYQVYTVYDFLLVRFGPISKNYVSGLFLVMRTLASGTRLFVPSLIMVLAWRMMTQHGTISVSDAPLKVNSYIQAILLLSAVTCLYTTFGGIKAVIWTDLAQATLMIASVVIAIFTLLYHIGNDNWNLMNGLRTFIHLAPQMKTHAGYFILGWESWNVKDWMQARGINSMTAWEYVRLTLGSDYTLFSAIIAATFANVAAFGTDQDMVQRLLSAQTSNKSRQSLITASLFDVPIAMGFALIGVLLLVYYQIDPKFKPQATADVFASYILNVMPVGIRGFILAGVFATAMGSLSAALNALATSATNDWYIPYFARNKSQAYHVGIARVFTVVFAVLMVGVAALFADVKVLHPQVRIIPVVLGVAGLFLGPMLGVFLVGMLTATRGSDRGNVLAITAGLAGIFFLSGQHIAVLNIVTGRVYQLPRWMPVIAWPWFTTFGTIITFIVAILFSTPRAKLLELLRSNQQPVFDEALPLALRGTKPVSLQMG